MQYIQYNWLYLLISIIVYAIMLSVSKPATTYLNPQKNNYHKGYFVFVLLYIVNSVVGVWAEDTYHIWDGFIDAGQYGIFELTGYEGIYNWLASITGNNYFLWRFIIWAPACMFMFFTARRLNIANRNFLLSFALFGGFLAFTRGMLGHAMLVYGLSLVWYNYGRNNLSSKIIGLLLIFASYFFHKSMYINIIFAAIALIPYGKYVIKLSLPLFPLAIIIASMTVDTILAEELEVAYGEGVGGVGDRTMSYLLKEKSEVTLYGYIGKTISLLPIYFTMYYLYNRIYVKKYFKKLKNRETFCYLYRLAYIALYISSAYLFLPTSEWISQRFMYMSYFPLVFVLGKVWSIEPKTNNYIKFIILSQLFALSYTYLYKIIKWYSL